MLVYLSRRNRTETAVDDDAVFMVVKMLKARFKLDLNCYTMMKDVKSFLMRGVVNVICCVVDDELMFFFTVICKLL